LDNLKKDATTSLVRLTLERDSHTALQDKCPPVMTSDNNNNNSNKPVTTDAGSAAGNSCCVLADLSLNTNAEETGNNDGSSTPSPSSPSPQHKNVKRRSTVPKGFVTFVHPPNCFPLTFLTRAAKVFR